MVTSLLQHATRLDRVGMQLLVLPSIGGLKMYSYSVVTLADAARWAVERNGRP